MRVYPKSSHRKKKNLTVVMDVNLIYHGDHFDIYTNTESLCCISKTNKMLYVNCVLIKKNRQFNFPNKPER